MIPVNSYINFLLEANLCLLLLGSFYLLVLRKERHFKLKRYYLLAGTAMSILIPFLDLANPFPGEYGTSFFYPFQSMILPGVTIVGSASYWQELGQSTIAFSLNDVFITLYGLGILVLLATFLFQLYRLFTFYRLRKSLQIVCPGYILVPTDGKWPTFSFFKLLFFDNTLTLSKSEKDNIIRHEEAHIKQWHSADIVFFELVKILFWFNPMAWQLRKTIQHTHEFLADEDTLKSNDLAGYKSLLAKIALGRVTPSFGNHFNKSLILKRIENMKTPPSKPSVLKWSGALSLMVTLVIVFSCNEPAIDHSDQIVETALADQEVYQIVDETAVPPGGYKKFYQYITENMTYPAQARKAGIEGKVYVQFIVDKNGNLTDVEVVKGIGGGCDREAVRVVAASDQWSPPQLGGKAVRQKIILPITFKLGDPKKTYKDKSTGENIGRIGSENDILNKNNAALRPVVSKDKC